MERTRYFRSANKFNTVVDFMAGNFFPLSDEDTGGYVSRVWGIFAWSLKITYLTSVVLGTVHFANLTVEQAFKKCGAIGVLSAELLIPAIYLNLQRKELRNLIRMYNDILVDSDDLRRFIQDTVAPYKKGLKLYTIAALVAAYAWTGAPLLQIISKDLLPTHRFTYADFSVPAYFPGEPFVPKVFAAGVIFQMIGDGSIHFGKISIDVYISNLIGVLSAEYKFCRLQLAKAFSQDIGEKDDSSVIDELKKCIEHHSAVIQAGRMLTKLTSLYAGATYINTILKFCFLGFGIIRFGSANMEKIAYSMYIIASIVQVFLICASVQELLDVSTAVTEDAFHENWHARSYTVKKIFSTIEVTNQMECRISAYRIIDLVVPTLAAMLSKSYSVCLLLLEVQ